MNKQIDEQFEGITDSYVLQCMCTEMKEKIIDMENRIAQTNSFLNKCIKNYSDDPFYGFCVQLENPKTKMWYRINEMLEEAQRILKEGKKWHII